MIKKLPVEIFDTVYFLSTGEVIFIGTMIACAIVAMFVSIKR